MALPEPARHSKVQFWQRRLIRSLNPSYVYYGMTINTPLTTRYMKGVLWCIGRHAPWSYHLTSPLSLERSQRISQAANIRPRVVLQVFFSSKFRTSSAFSPCVLSKRYNSSFIKQVMDQVKKEMETNEDLKRSVREFHESGVAETSSDLKRQFTDAFKRVADTAEKVKDRTASLRSQAQDQLRQIEQAVEKLSASNQLMKSTIETTSAIFKATGSGINFVSGSANKVLECFNDERAEKVRRTADMWRKNMERNRHRGTEQTAEHYNESAAGSTTNDADPEGPKEYALVVSEESAWERFGTRLRDMPFLQNFFENPVLGKLFGESTQAAAIREMKAIDPTFNLPDLVDLMEHLIAPHALHCFLVGEREALKLQCGEVAYAAIEASIKERENLKLKLDPSILLLRNVEFRGATIMTDSHPWFIFTFTAQQINCMRDKNNAVILGAVDDIREVTYSVAVKKHPHPELEGLLFPWQVCEFAIIGNSPCW